MRWLTFTSIAQGFFEQIKASELHMPRIAHVRSEQRESNVCEVCTLILDLSDAPVRILVSRGERLPSPKAAGMQYSAGQALLRRHRIMSKETQLRSRSCGSYPQVRRTKYYVSSETVRCTRTSSTTDSCH